MERKFQKMEGRSSGDGGTEAKSYGVMEMEELWRMEGRAWGLEGDNKRFFFI